jgi:molybdenum cofactor guanylyltransferase
MFRYLTVIILSGGQSKRMGFNKENILLNGLRLIDEKINFFLSIGFNNINISGKITGYNNIHDFIIVKGPMSGIFTILNFKKNIIFMFFVPVDLCLISIESIFLFFFNLNFNFSFFYKDNFPNILFYSYSLLFNTNKILFKINKKKSLYFFSKFINKKTINLKNFFNLKFLNVNTYLNFFLLK